MVTSTSTVDVILIGGGIMSATLGTLMQAVRPDASITLIERLGDVGLESSSPWHNAGTGHAALCELHYTPRLLNGEIDVSKAVQVNEQFQLSLQFYAWLVERGIAPDPSAFINPVPHIGFARGEDDIDFLRDRHAAMAPLPQFAGTAYTDDPATIAEWAPMVMQGRDPVQPVAATRHQGGTDVDFGALTRILVAGLRQRGVDVRTGTQVEGLERLPRGGWKVSTRDRASGERRSVETRFVFVGAGGTAVRLLQQSGIPEIKGMGGFPVSGLFLRCRNPERVARHHAKVYGRPAPGAPPMTAPHLDTRIINGERGLLYGPFAGFSPKYLKNGSYTDLFRSIRRDNILTLLNVARKEIPFTTYLIGQLLQRKEGRIDHLRQFVAEAEPGDWDLITSGQRVQIMRRTATSRGVLQFGTELVATRDGSIAGLLGASPGASTATAIMLDVLKRCFPADFERWAPALREVVPTLGVSLASEQGLDRDVRARVSRVLGLDVPVATGS